jgi:enoyl-CoA hydratase/carnithine racemase
MTDFIQVSVDGGVQTIRIRRPEKKNALNLAMYLAMAGALRKADGDEAVRVSVITGTADCFCAGNDIADFVEHPPEDESSPVLQFVEALVHAEKPIVAAVSGIAVGIGTTMLLHCDLAYAGDNARFQMPFVNIGLCPEAGSTFLLPAMMGHARAAELLLLGQPFGAGDAVRLGIANAVVPAAQVEHAALEAARRIAAQPPNAVRTTKTLLRKALRDSVLAAARRESENFIAMVKGPEAGAALQAFLSKKR